jgi:hypothetical protein
VFAHLLKRTEHSSDCIEDPQRGLLCADDCRTRQFLAWLKEPLEFEVRKQRAEVERKLNEHWKVA